VDVTAEPVRVDGRSVLVLHVPYSAQRPHTLAGSGEVLLRRDAATEPARSEDVQRLAIEASLRAFEDAPVPGATLDDLDLGAFQDFLARRSPSGSVPPEANGTDPGTLLRNLGFVSPPSPLPPIPDGTAGASDAPAGQLVPTVAAILLFGRAPQRFLPQARVELVRFAGTAPPTESAGEAGMNSLAADRATAGGTLPEQLERSLDFIRRHMRVGIRVEGFGRHDVPEYPLEVVREVLVNALVHRDYAQRGAAVEVRMYFDRWEVASPGRLPGPLVPASLIEGGPERLARNPRLAETARVLGLGEGLGLGLRRVRAALQHAGYPPAEIEEGAFSVHVTLAGAFEAHGRQAWLQRARNALTRRGGNRRQLRAVAYLGAHPDLDALTNADYRRLTRVSEMTAFRDLSDLVERGILVRRGEKRGAYYAPAIDLPAHAAGTRSGRSVQSGEGQR
jgi:ATP-dependent DNA helicase RecG